MNVTVTGAQGFVGQAVAGLLTARGHEVTGLARPEWDLTAPGAWSAVPDKTGIIIHTAAAFESQSPEEVLWQTNVTSIMGLLHRSRELSRLSHVIFCSSGAVYSPQEDPVDQTTAPRPHTAYGMSKLLGETMLRHGCAVPVTSLRLFFPFGAGQNPPRLIPRLIESICSGQPVKLRDVAGTPRLNPVPVARVSGFIAELCEIANSTAGRIFNLGGPVTLTIKELAERIGRRLGREPAFEIEPADGTTSLYCTPTGVSGTVEEFEDASSAAVESRL